MANQTPPRGDSRTRSKRSKRSKPAEPASDAPRDFSEDLLDLDACSVEDLSRYAEIDMGTAERIVRFRNQRGAIDDLESLREVKGVDDALLERLRQRAA